MRPPGLLDDAPVSGKQAAGRTVQSPRPGGLRCVTLSLLPSRLCRCWPCRSQPHRLSAGNELIYEGPALPVSGCTPHRVGLVPSLTEDTTNCPKTALVDQFFLTDRDLVSPQGNE